MGLGALFAPQGTLADGVDERSGARRAPGPARWLVWVDAAGGWRPASPASPLGARPCRPCSRSAGAAAATAAAGSPSNAPVELLAAALAAHSDASRDARAAPAT